MHVLASIKLQRLLDFCMKLRMFSNAIARGISTVVALSVAGWGVNGICLAAGICSGIITGLRPLIAVPAWFGTAVPIIRMAAPAIDAAVHDTLCGAAPRALGYS